MAVLVSKNMFKVSEGTKDPLKIVPLTSNTCFLTKEPRVSKETIEQHKNKGLLKV